MREQESHHLPHPCQNGAQQLQPFYLQGDLTLTREKPQGTVQVEAAGGSGTSSGLSDLLSKDNPDTPQL